MMVKRFNDFVNESEKQLINEAKEDKDWMVTDDNIQYWIKNIGKYHKGDEREAIGEKVFNAMTKAISTAAKSGLAKPKKIIIEL